MSHTLRVASISERIAHSLPLDTDEVDYAWFLGLLHDFGRFEQVRRYGTFVDAVSVDHAELGADLLFQEGLITLFPTAGLAEPWQEEAEQAVRLHNKLNLPEDLSPEHRLFCEILRDADKADIFRVIAEIPFEKRAGKSKNLLQDLPEASEEVMRCVYEHRCVPREARHSPFDVLLSHGCMAFELFFPETRRIVAEQGFLEQLLADTEKDGRPRWNAREAEQLKILRQEIQRNWREKQKEAVHS